MFHKVNNDKKANILILSEVFYPEIGSGANRITNLVNSLITKGYEVDIITSEPNYPDRTIYDDLEFFDIDKYNSIKDKINIIRVRGSKLRVNANFLKRIYIYIFFAIKVIIKVIFLNKKYDLIIATTPSLFMGLVGVVAKLRYRCKYILDIRDLWPECIKNIGIFKKKKKLLKLAYSMEKIILKRCDSIVINSDGFREYLNKYNFNKEIIFIPNGIRIEELKELKELKKEYKKHETFTVIYTGLIGLPQNIKSIVRVARHLRRYDNIRFKIIGTGIQVQKVIDLINHYNLINIEIIKPMPKMKTLKEIIKCHVALVHLRSDSAFDLVIPGKIIDYMAIGIPIVAGVEGYTASIINNSKSGVVVEPDDYKSMAEKISEIYNNYQHSDYYERNGQKFCEENFLWDKNIIEYINLIERVLGNEKEFKKGLHVRMESFHQ